MKKYVIRTGTGEDFNAAGKARRDADEIAVSVGYEPFVFEGDRTANGSVSGAVRLIREGFRNWKKLIRTAETGSIVLFQYPHYPMKSAYLARRMIPQAKRKKGLRFITLVHDLDSLRGLHGRGAVYSDTKVLPLFDAVICHNEKMKAYLTGQGIPAEKLVTLDLFDYLTDAVLSDRKPEEGFAIAGNLSPEKCGYVLEWIRKAGTERPIHLYGKGLDREEVPEGTVVHGAVAAEELPGVIDGGFGIVWDGLSAENCAGQAGNYLRYNNPHKLSLYLASGMPVIVWKEAAVAGFVREHGVGLAVGSLLEAEEAAGKVSAEEYAEMARKAGGIGEKLKRGEYLLGALKKTEKILHVVQNDSL